MKYVLRCNNNNQKKEKNIKYNLFIKKSNRVIYLIVFEIHTFWLHDTFPSNLID